MRFPSAPSGVPRIEVLDAPCHKFSLLTENGFRLTRSRRQLNFLYGACRWIAYQLAAVLFDALLQWDLIICGQIFSVFIEGPWTVDPASTSPSPFKMKINRLIMLLKTDFSSENTILGTV